MAFFNDYNPQYSYHKYPKQFYLLFLDEYTKKILLRVSPLKCQFNRAIFGQFGRGQVSEGGLLKASILIQKKYCTKAKMVKIITSAIPGMTVAEVRKQLDKLRKQWDRRSYGSPFFLCNNLPADIAVDEFSTDYVMGQHQKRQRKKKSGHETKASGNA